MALLPSPKSNVIMHISTWSIVKIILILVGFYALYLVIDVLALLFVSMILAAALDPTVDWLHEKKIPRSLSILSIYAIAFGIISLALFLLVPALITQLNEISRSFPVIVEKATSLFNTVNSYAIDAGFAQEVQSALRSVQSKLVQATGGVLSTFIGIFGGLISFFTVLIITFYITVEEEAIKRFVFSSVPQKHQVFTMKLINAVQHKIGLWLRGQLILMFIIGLMTYIGLWALGIQYALLLALIAGIAEFIPFLGPIIASIPAIFIAFTQSPAQAIGVVILYIIIQQLENNLIVPKLMQKSVGLNPLVVIVVLFIGGSLAGVVGAIFSIPVATAISVILQSDSHSGKIADA